MRVPNEILLWKDVTLEEWSDWRWQVRNRITDVESLKQVVPLSPQEEDGVRACLKRFRMAITPYYASQMDPEDPTCPIRAQAIPTAKELQLTTGDMEDPLAEEIDAPVPGLTHRYPDRALLLLTTICSMYCRHCTRRRLVGTEDEQLDKAQIEAAIDYIARTGEIRDVILSGGDPLMFADDKLEWIVARLRAIPHVDIIRIGSRTPCVLPMRITDELCDMLRKYHPIYVNTHFNHALELTPESREACARLVDHGFPVQNQSVLLRGVNDCPHVMKQLLYELLKARVKPYYIFQCDLARGIGHFRTPISQGIGIMEALRGHISGLAIPTYVVDCPGGGGKVPVGPTYLISSAPDGVVLRNFEGTYVTYHEHPAPGPSICGQDPACHDRRLAIKDGPARLLDNQVLAIRPEKLRRRGRRLRTAPLGAPAPSLDVLPADHARQLSLEPQSAPGKDPAVPKATATARGEPAPPVEKPRPAAKEAA
ncbi:MAG: lysine 2,3-aminomutase, partial [Deltaproteobacteria bacterium]|nr:lysine 2,3-aminomutase [Deltaproteobacteria bacterium]